MSLRIGVDMDGTVADLSSIYHAYEVELFGQATADEPTDLAEEEPEPSTKEKLKAAKAKTKQHDAVWRALRSTPNFWTLLKPIEAGAVSALYAAAEQHKWEVFFITQRPRSAGASVQKQTQEWLIAQGFKTPSVLTLSGSRGKAAHALDLDFLIDDLPKNCIDVISDSKCRPLLVVRNTDPKAEGAAQRMGIGVVRSVAAAIELLSKPAPEPRETAVGRILRTLGLSR